jgi:glycine betaine/proline transport system substrate-binding protein
MQDIEIKRGYEVLSDNNVRFGIRVINNSDSAISDVEILLDYSDSLFELSGNKVQKLGNIPPTVPRTAKFILKPLGCIHKENIGATIIYKDHQWKKHTIEMNPKEVHCVCPFLKEKSIKRSDFLTLSKSGFFEERGVNFEGITVEKLVEFITHTCKNRLYRVDEFPIENGKIIYLAGDALGEKAYYLLTAIVKEYEGLAQVLLRANSDKNYGLNGF